MKKDIKKSMNKGELVAFMADNSKLTKAESERALTLTLDSFTHAFEQGHDITLVGFGSFHIRKRKAREGRNPKTGQKMHISAYNQLVFSAGKKTKEACN